MPQQPLELQPDPQHTQAVNEQRIAGLISALTRTANQLEHAEAVTAAVLANRFWILTHEHAAVRTTEQRAAWMGGGDPPRINLEGATKP